MNGLMESLIEKQADEYAKNIFGEDDTYDIEELLNIKQGFIDGANFILSLMGNTVHNDLCHVVEFEGKTKIYLHNYVVSNDIECTILFTGSLDSCKDYVTNTLKHD